VESRALEEGKLCTIHHKVAVAPLWANLLSYPGLRTFLLLQSRQMNHFVVQREQREHNLVRAIGDGPWADTSPVSYRLGACSIAVVTSAIEKDRELCGNGRLGHVGVVVENGVLTNLLN
jgi:hypothetical protein